MRFLLQLLLFIFFSITAVAQGPLITEIHYDNNYDQYGPFGIDSIEHVEIYLPDPQPTDPESFKIVTYRESPSDTTQASKRFIRDLDDAIRTWDTPNGMYYVIEFVDTIEFTYPSAGMDDGEAAVALVEIGTPNIVHQFWRYETCDPFTAIDGPANGATSSPVTSDFSRTCGSSGVGLVQMNSTMNTNRGLQQNGFGDWYVMGLGTTREPPLENNQNVPVKMMYFRVFNHDSSVELTWATAQEYDNDYFEILHSRNGKDFSPLGKVDGKGNYVGESRYGYEHKKPAQGRHYYKIRQIDFNGDYEDFEIRSVDVEYKNVVQVNPSSTDYDFTLLNVENGTVFSIFDIQGKEVMTDNYQNRIDVSGLVNGLYIVHVNGQTTRFNKF